MNGRIFIDTNILVYAFLENEKEKHDKAFDLLTKLGNQEAEVFISTQILSELYSALSKNNVEHELIKNYLFEIADSMNIHSITFETIKRYLSLKERYQYAYWDSLVLASALENKCFIIYSEDMQDGQIIEKTLLIKNPL